MPESDLRATHARTLLPAALASVSSGFVLVRVRVRCHNHSDFVASQYGRWPHELRPPDDVKFSDDSQKIKRSDVEEVK